MDTKDLILCREKKQAILLNAKAVAWQEGDVEGIEHFEEELAKVETVLTDLRKVQLDIKEAL